MIRHAAILFAVTVGLSFAHAQDNRAEKNPDPSSENTVNLQSFIGQDVCLTIEIDVTSLDVNASKAFLEKLTREELPPALANGVNEFVDALVAAGVKKAYLIATIGAIGDVLWRLERNGNANGITPLLVLPCNKPDQVQAALAALTQKMGLTTSSLQIQKLAAANNNGPNFVLIGNRDAVKRAHHAAQPNRDALNEALLATNQLTHKAIVSLPAEARRDLLALWPETMPTNIPVSVSPRAMVEDISWIAISADLPPELKLQIQIKTVGKEALLRVKNAISTSLALTGPIKQHIKMTTTDRILTLGVATEPLLELVAVTPLPASAQQKLNSLKQIGLAIHNYHNQYQHLPPRCFTDPAGKPLHSWRVAILPFIEQQAVYKALNLKEAWNAASNQKLTATMIPLYTNSKSEPTKTTFRAPVMMGSLWQGDGPPKRFQDLTDGLSATIAIIDAPQSAATSWADPKPWVISAENPMADVFGDRDTATALMLDGAVRTLKKSEMNNEKLRAMLTTAGGEAIQF